MDILTVVSVGHSGEVGATANGTTEFAECNKIVNAVKEKLALYENAPRVLYVPTNIKLTPRIAWINARVKPTDKLIEVHMDSGNVNSSGSMAYFYGGSGESKEQADEILNVYCATTGIPNNQEKPDTQSRFNRLGIIRDTKCWAWLLEMGFITNPNELAVMRAKAADGVVAAIFAMNDIVPILKNTSDMGNPISTWAQPSVERAKKKGISDWSNPQEKVSPELLKDILFKLGLISEDKLVTKEQLITVIDRLKQIV